MAVTISPALQAALNDPERVAVGLFTFLFGTGTYGLWTGKGEKTYNGIVYRAGGSLLDLSDISTSIDGSVTDLKIGLSTEAGKGLSSDVLETFYNEDWHQRPVTVQLGLLDPVTRNIVGVRTVFRGLADTAPFIEGVNSSKIELVCVSRSIDLSKPGGKYRNRATQVEFDSTDTALDDIGTLNGAITARSRWGQSR